MCCPITKDIMKYPVIAADGHTYEREAIEKWLAQRRTSPVTNQALARTELTPNHSIKSLIAAWHEKNGEGGSGTEKHPEERRLKELKELKALASAVHVSDTSEEAFDALCKLSHFVSMQEVVLPSTLGKRLRAALEADEEVWRKKKVREALAAVETESQAVLLALEGKLCQAEVLWRATTRAIRHSEQQGVQLQEDVRKARATLKKARDVEKEHMKRHEELEQLRKQSEADEERIINTKLPGWERKRQQEGGEEDNPAAKRRKTTKEAGAYALFVQGRKLLDVENDIFREVRLGRLLIELADQEGVQSAVAECLYQGWGREQDHRAAVEMLQEALKSDRPCPFAQFRLGVCYKNGEGVAQDDAKAAEWYTKAAEQGHTEAQYELAVCYEYGLGVTEDRAKAVAWFHQAAHQRHSGAQRMLTIMASW